MSKRLTFEQQQEQERRREEQDQRDYEVWKDHVDRIAEYPDIPEASMRWLYKMEPDAVSASIAVLAVELAKNIKETLDEEAKQAESTKGAEGA